MFFAINESRAFADSCNVPADPGPCRGSFLKIFYDPNARACREFRYGGCDGNANRFSNVPECESVCLHHEEPVPPGNDTAFSHLGNVLIITNCTLHFNLNGYGDKHVWVLVTLFS